MNCPRPNCKGRIKKVDNEDGTYYYHCPSCNYSTQPIRKLFNLKRKKK